MYQRVKAYVEKYHMLQENDHVITGVSGGADSVCLLFMLKEFKNEMPLELTVCISIMGSAVTVQMPMRDM